MTTSLADIENLVMAQYWAASKILYEQSHPGLSSYRGSECVWNIFSSKTDIRVGYTLCTVPSVRFTRWKNEAAIMSHYIARDIQRTTTSVNYLSVISAQVRHMSAHWAKILLREYYLAARIQKQGKSMKLQKRADVTWIIRAQGSPSSTWTARIDGLWGLNSSDFPVESPWCWKSKHD